MIFSNHRRQKRFERRCREAWRRAGGTFVTLSRTLNVDAVYAIGVPPSFQWPKNHEGHYRQPCITHLEVMENHSPRACAEVIACRLVGFMEEMRRGQ